MFLSSPAPLQIEVLLEGRSKQATWSRFRGQGQLRKNLSTAGWKILTPVCSPENYAASVGKALTFINTVTFVGSATEPRSRREDESMPRHRRGGATRRWDRPAPTLRADGGCRQSLCLSSSPMSLHRLLLSSRPPLASPIRKRYRIYEREYKEITSTLR